MPVILLAARSRRKRHQQWSAVVICLGTAFLGCSLGYLLNEQSPARPVEVSTAHQSSQDLGERPTRKVYLYSVLPGGIESSEELATKLQDDSVAARHYSDFKVERAVLVYARFKQEAAYVSFRKGSQIFWTRKRVHVANSEMLLTDGRAFARTRCGNRLSDKPQKPTTENEPSEEALLFVPTFMADRMIQLPADVEEAPRLQGKPPFVLPTPGAILPFEEVVKPLSLVPLTSGFASNAPTPLGNSPEPATLVFLTSGCLLFAFFSHRRRKA